MSSEMLITLPISSFKIITTGHLPPQLALARDNRPKRRRVCISRKVKQPQQMVRSAPHDTKKQPEPPPSVIINFLCASAPRYKVSKKIRLLAAYYTFSSPRKTRARNTIQSILPNSSLSGYLQGFPRTHNPKLIKWGYPIVRQIVCRWQRRGGPQYKKGNNNYIGGRQNINSCSTARWPPQPSSSNLLRGPQLHHIEGHVGLVE